MRLVSCMVSIAWAVRRLISPWLIDHDCQISVIWGSAVAKASAGAVSIGSHGAVPGQGARGPSA